MRPAVVGISVLTRNSEAAFAFAREVVLCSRIPVILGGPHATLCPGECLSREGVAGVVRGDGEDVFPRIVEAMCEHRSLSVPGWVPREGAAASIGGIAREADLDRLPMADREVFPTVAYGRHPFRDGVYAPVITSRGCGRSCAFCSAPALSGSPRRVRNVKSVAKEVAELQMRHGVTDILFEDDQFLEDRDHVLELCALLRNSGSSVRWSLPNGVPVDLLDGELLAEMARSGCRQIALGVESGSEEIRRGIGRPCSERRIRDVVRHAQALGIAVAGYFVQGFPAEGPTAQMKTVLLALSVPFDHVHFSTFEPLPGSRFSAETRPRPAAARMIRTAAYACAYASPSRIARLARRGEITPGALPAVARRFVSWLRA